MDATSSWLSIALSLGVLAAYELALRLAARRDPEAVARTAHLRLRSDWVEALSRHPGSEIIAVQALRNSLMSATITASTAALALMGSVTLIASNLGGWRSAGALPEPTVRGLLDLLLVGNLFASFVCSAMAARFYNHAGYPLSMPVGSPERERRMPMAVNHLQRAGVLYSWSLRYFMLVAPIVAGLIHPMLMPPVTVLLVLVLRSFDRLPSNGV